MLIFRDLFRLAHSKGNSPAATAKKKKKKISSGNGTFVAMLETLDKGATRLFQRNRLRKIRHWRDMNSKGISPPVKYFT